MRPPPAHPVLTQDAAHLAAPDLDALRLGGRRQGVERPLRDVPALAAGRGERPVGIGDESTRWGTGHQRDDGAALGLAQARLAPAARLHPQPVEPTRVEGVEAFAYGLRMTILLLGDGSRAQPVPAARNHARVHDPIGGGMQTAGQPPHLGVFSGIEGWTSSKQLRHGAPPCPACQHILDQF
jgi:hypothetical protein